MSQESDMFVVMRLPYPWPPAEPYLLCGGNANGLDFELFALNDGRIELKTSNIATSFISQPIDIQSDRPAWTMLRMTLTASDSSLEFSGQTLLKDAPHVPRLLLTSAQGLVLQEFSVNDPSANTACQNWIQNRRSKFSQPQTSRPDRRPKTIQEQGQDLIASIYRLRHLQQLTRAGNRHLLGTLAGEMRASVYWPKGRDTQPDRNWSPLLLRMASMADLPLPVYSIPDIPEPQMVKDAIVRLELSKAPRIERMFATDQICDLQEALIKTVLRLGPAPGKVITALELIKELAHTMGAAHYDEDASSFMDVMHSMKSSEGDQATIFMCQTADTLASLSEWLVSELKTRNLIS
jgi:hypothetical protein